MIPNFYAFYHEKNKVEVRHNVNGWSFQVLNNGLVLASGGGYDTHLEAEIKAKEIRLLNVAS